MGLDGRLNVVLQVPVFGIGDVIDAQLFFDRDPTLVRNTDGAMLFVDHVVAGEKLLAFPQLDAELLLALGIAPLDLFA